MAPLPTSLVGYRVSYEAIEQYCDLKSPLMHSNRLLVEDFESKIGIPLALVRVESDEDGGAAPDHYYICCFADYSGRPYTTEELSAVPVPSAFHQLPQLIPVEGELCRLFAPRSVVSTGGVRPTSYIVGGHV